VVPAGYDNSAAFNGQTATASNQLCCGVLSKTGGSFTIDDPIDPQNKILNHYFRRIARHVESLLRLGRA